MSLIKNDYWILNCNSYCAVKTLADYKSIHIGF